MTEVERIVQKGIIAEDFLKPQIICDFYVDENRKKAWAVQLDLLIEFDKFCSEHELKYFLSVGTLLGAVRHKGFIPWDDDIDVEMPRKEYERLQKLCGMFKSPYFLQTPYTDPYYAFSHIRLINENTTCFTELFKYQPMKHCMYLDIFPLDSFDGNVEKGERVNKIIDELNYRNSTYMRLLNPNLDEKNKERVNSYKTDDHIEAYERIQEIAQSFEEKKSKFYIRAVRSVYDYNKYHFLKCDYSDSIEIEFAGYKFPAPIGYERILTTQFGDFNLFPPVAEIGKHHIGFVIEPDISYKAYFKNQYINLND